MKLINTNKIHIFTESDRNSAKDQQDTYMQTLATILLPSKNWCDGRARHLGQNTL